MSGVDVRGWDGGGEWGRGFKQTAGGGERGKRGRVHGLLWDGRLHTDDKRGYPR